MSFNASFNKRENSVPGSRQFWFKCWLVLARVLSGSGPCDESEPLNT